MVLPYPNAAWRAPPLRGRRGCALRPCSRVLKFSRTRPQSPRTFQIPPANKAIEEPTFDFGVIPALFKGPSVKEIEIELLAEGRHLSDSCGNRCYLSNSCGNPLPAWTKTASHCVDGQTLPRTGIRRGAVQHRHESDRVGVGIDDCS
jgi:hypothetical protein